MTWLDLFGTTKSYFKLGFLGVRLKNLAGNLGVRNAGDSADAEVTASKVNISGDSIDINSDAAEAAADWIYTLSRPVSGMIANVALVLPPDDGSPAEVLTTDGDGNLTWEPVTGASPSIKMDTTSLGFGDVSPVAMFNIGAADIVERVKIIIDTAFDGAPSLSIGITGETSKYASATDIDLTQPAGTVMELNPAELAPGGAESLIATYAAGGATAGAARILLHYGEPT